MSNQDKLTMKPVSKTADGAEVYGSAAPAAVAETLTETPKPKEMPKIKEEELKDPVDAVIESGTRCKRPSCKAIYSGDASKTEECIFHSGEPVFHEGSKVMNCNIINVRDGLAVLAKYWNLMNSLKFKAVKRELIDSLI